ncbi:serine/threonine kinase [Aureococcus anophagefferens]|nr:serine/threonine kinase [Aureococcus anophagefferens]
MKSTSSSCGTLEGLAAAEEVVTVPEDDDLLEELRLSSEQVGARRAGAEACLDDFDVLSQIGEGGFGKVVLAKKRDGGSPRHQGRAQGAALHAGEAAVQHMLDENHILQTMRHPFILTLQYAFQDATRLYLVTNFVGGGNLYQLITRLGVLGEPLARFYAAQLVSAFSYLHGQGIVYRDLKPENVLLGLDGYVVLADFGLAKTLGLEEKKVDPLRASFRTSVAKAETFCGTPLYLAPEVVAKMPYGRSLIKTGTPSFLTSAKLGAAAKDCCAKLLERKPEDRLGCGEGLGVKALEAHAFFADVPWRSLEAKRETPPFLPDPATDVMGRVHALSEQTENVAKPLFDDFRAFNRDSRTALREPDSARDAARADDLEALKAMAARGVDVAAGDENRRTPCTSPPRHGAVVAFLPAFLLSEGADVAARDRWGGTPLGDAAREGHDAVCALLRAEGARDDDVPDDTGASSGPRDADAANAGKLLEAAKRGDRDALRRLLDAAVDVNGADYDRRTALHLAAPRASSTASRRRGDVGGIRALLASGVDVNGGDYDKRTALHLAAAEGHADAVRFLIDEKAAIDVVDRWRGTPLRDAEDGNHLSVVALLRKHGAAETGRRPRASSAADALIDGGADVTAGDYDKRTALHLAAAEGHVDAVRFLVDRGANVDAVDRWHGTPLRDAEQGHHAAVVKLVRERGAATPPSATPRRRSRSWGSLVAMPSPRRIGKALTKKHSMPVLPYDDSNDPPEPESPGLVINPPRKADDEHQKAELDRSNGSCAIA